jgi:hypothetical protein
MINLKFILLIFIILALLSCKSHYDIKTTLKGEKIIETQISIDSLLQFKNVQANLEIRNINRIKIFKFDNVYYSFIINADLKKYNNDSVEVNDNLLFNDTFVYFDNNNKIGYFKDSMNFVMHYAQLFSTENFLYFIGSISGSFQIFKKPYNDYIEAVLLINKFEPLNIKKIDYKNEKFVLVEQKEEFLRIITTELEPTFSIIDWLGSKITDHQWIGEFVSTGKYKEYLYNQSLELVSTKEIDKDKIE